MKLHAKVLFVFAVFAWLTAHDARALRAEIAYPLVTDIANGGVGFGVTNVFASGGGAPFQVDDAGDDPALEDDAVGIAVYSMNGNGANDGAGFSVSISNGANDDMFTVGMPDVPNTEPVNAAITAVNNGARLQNGNAIRASVWLRQDPEDPVTVEPQIEPVFKIELWKEALSGNADFSAVDYPGGGDRIWDTDQNAGTATHVAGGQSQATWIDMGNDGSTSFGKPIGATLVTDEWRLVETTLVIDDDPENDGFGWSIGAEFFDVSDVEEIRTVLFVGDFASTVGLNGSFWADNLLVELFTDEASMLATPNPNLANDPGDVAELPGDFNEDGSVDAADYTLWRDRLGSATALPNGGPGGVTIDDYNTWKANFGDMAPGGGAGAVGAAAAPEPASLVLLGIAILAITRCRR